MTARAVRPTKQLRARVAELEDKNRSLELRNTLTQLVAGLRQSNLTSFEPIFESNVYQPLTMQYTVLAYMYKTHGIIQTAIDMPVLDALRGGVDIQSEQLDQDDERELIDELEEEGVFDLIGEGMIWTRLFGGGGWIINTDQKASTPLNPLTVGKISIVPFARWEMRNPSRFADMYDYWGTKIHPSRVITMAGKSAPFNIRPLLQGWGMSEVERITTDFNSYIQTKNVLYELLRHAKQDVMRLDGLGTALMSDGGTAAIQTRIQGMNQVRDFTNALVLDKEDEYDIKQPTLTGIAEIMAENRMAIASATRIPQAKLFGMSASGFSSGEDSIENYNAMVESEIRQPLKKPIRQLLRLWATMKFGFEPDLRFKFHALRVLSAVEEENVKTQKHNRVLAGVQAGLITPEEYGQIAQKENLFPMELGAARGEMDDLPDPAMPEEDGEDE